MSKIKDRFQFVKNKEGHEVDFVSHYELKPKTLEKLNTQQGKDVEVWVDQESWLYVSPYAEEDHTSSKIHVFGTLVEANRRCIVLDIKAGEINYGNITLSAPAGKTEYPYRREQFQLKRYAEVLKIDKLAVGGQTFQWGKISGQGQGKVSA